MLRIVEGTDIVQEINVYEDDQSYYTYYLLPNQPRYRLDEQGRPVFKFIKYRFPIDREDGTKGGGYLVFDCEFVVPQDKIVKVKKELQERVNKETRDRFGSSRTPPDVKLGTISYSKGTVDLIISENNEIVQKVHNPGTPSLYGKNISTFAVELTPEGATLFESAMQGNGGLVSVYYNLWVHAKLPPVKIHGRFYSEKFYSFYQTISVDWHFWGEDDYDEKIREEFYDTESLKLEVDFGVLTDNDLKKQLRDWAQRTLEDTAEQKMLEAIAPVPDDDRNLPSGIEEFSQEITVRKIASFTLDYTEAANIEWNLAPQGTLPNITTLKDKDDNPIKWEDYSKVVDMGDPFFKQLNVAVQVNADFDRLLIHSIEVKINYPETDTWEKSISSSDEVKQFSAFLINNNQKYTYSYQVNYKNENQTLKIDEVETDDRVLIINVDDIGVLLIDVLAGDINFDQVTRAQVSIFYEDEEHNVGPIEQQFVIDKDHQEHEFLEVIFEPRRKQYKYQVKYFMKNGKEYLVDEAFGRSLRLYINDPFTVTKTITLIGNGLNSVVSMIFVDLKYVDENNDYSMTKSIILNKNQPFFDWSFPVIDELGGKVMYSGKIQYQDGRKEDIPETEAETGMIPVGHVFESFLKVEIVPELIDFNAVKLIKVSLSYEDTENSLSKKESIYFRQSDSSEIKIWKIELKDEDQKEYSWQATFYMTDGSKRTTEETTTEDTDFVLELPAA